MRIGDLQEFRDADGKLPAYTSFGCYPILYLMECGDLLCADCASDESEPEAIDADVYWEGPVIQCDGCGKDMESAYGDPEAEDDAPVPAEGRP